MASTFKEYVPKEQRMAEAIKAVQSGKMSQRAAALKFDVHHTSIGKALKRMENSHHPETSQSQPQKQACSERAQAIDPRKERNRRVGAIRRFAVQNGITHIEGKPVRLLGTGVIYQTLLDAKLDVPEDVIPPSFLRPKSQPVALNESNNVTQQTQQRLSSNDCVLVIHDREAETDSIDQHPAFADKLDIDAVRQQVNYEVQQSGRPADFKRAIELLTELDRICTDAWYRRHPEPWGHDDWAHVSSEIESIHSIVGQRAEETADELLRKSTAVEIKSTVIY